MGTSEPEPQGRVEWFLGPLFTRYSVIEFRGGTIFRGPASSYCQAHRREVEDGLRRLGSKHCFESLDGVTYLTCTLPGPAAKPVNRLLHAVLFAATVVTTLVAGADWRFDEFLIALGGSLTGASGSEPLGSLWSSLLTHGAPFSAAILVILGVHECGHYVLARRYGMLVTPPFFLPAPIPPIGTFGAVIKIRSPMLHRRALLDIGLAGPVAGFVVALPILIYGLSHCEFVLKEQVERHLGVLFGNSALTWGLTRLLVGVPPPGYVLNWLSNPFAWAGWIGLLVTALNLLPVGQLDGGHIAYALVGRWQRHFAYFVLGVLLVFLKRWPGWAVWGIVMIALIRIAHPPVVIEEVRLSPGRRVLGWVAMGLLLATFIPVPVASVP